MAAWLIAQSGDMGVRADLITGFTIEDAHELYNEPEDSAERYVLHAQAGPNDEIELGAWPSFESARKAMMRCMAIKNGEHLWVGELG